MTGILIVAVLAGGLFVAVMSLAGWAGSRDEHQDHQNGART